MGARRAKTRRFEQRRAFASGALAGRATHVRARPGGARPRRFFVDIHTDLNYHATVGPAWGGRARAPASRASLWRYRRARSSPWRPVLEWLLWPSNGSVSQCCHANVSYTYGSTGLDGSKSVYSSALE